MVRKIPRKVVPQMRMCPSLKTRGKTLPWLTPPVMAPLMEAKTKTANQSKSRSPTRKPQAQATRKGSSLKSPQTTM